MLVMGAGDVRVEGREDAAGIVAKQPDMTVVMRLEHMRFVERRRRIVDHMLEGDAMERGRRLVSRRSPGAGENQILDRHELQRTVSLRFVDENRGLEEIGVRTGPVHARIRSEEHTSELQSLMRISYAVFCLKQKTNHQHTTN